MFERGGKGMGGGIGDERAGESDGKEGERASESGGERGERFFNFALTHIAA